MRVVYLDTETTGLYPRLDDILEIAIVADDGSVLLDTLVRPVRNTEWPEAVRIHGISPEDVAHAPTLADLSPVIERLVEGKLVVIYNAQFDTGFLAQELDKADGIACCMLAWADHVGEWDDYHGGNRWWKLSDAADSVRHVWPETGAHRALADAMATRAVWRYLHDPQERARVDRQVASERVVEQDRYEMRLERLRQEATWERHGERMTSFWFAWWLRRPVPRWQSRPWDHRIRREDEYALTFFGYTNQILAHLDDAEARGLTRYTSTRDIPAYLVTQRALARMQIREGWYAPAVGYYVSLSGRRFSLLYDTRGNRLRKQLPEFAYRPIPEGYCTAHQLRTRYKLSAKQVARKKIIGYWRKPYTREWISLFKPPEREVSP